MLELEKNVNIVLKYYPDLVTWIQSCTEYQLQNFNHEFLDKLFIDQLVELIFV